MPALLAYYPRPKKKQWSATGFGWLLWPCSSWRASVRAMTPEGIQMWCDRRCDIFHLNFTAWLDHNAPPQPQDLLLSLKWDAFPDWAQSSHTAHWLWMLRDPDCTDVVLGLIDQDLAFDISDFVHCILQKHGMVETDDQYLFCYQVILYVLTCLQTEEEQKEQPQPPKWPEKNSLLDALPVLQWTSNAPGSLHLK